MAPITWIISSVRPANISRSVIGWAGGKAERFNSAAPLAAGSIPGVDLVARRDVETRKAGGQRGLARGAGAHLDVGKHAGGARPGRPGFASWQERLQSIGKSHTAPKRDSSRRRPT